MGVVAKFHVNTVLHREYGGAEVQLSAVHPQDDDDHVTRDENEKFFEATPQASLTMQITNAPAAEQFQPGQDFYVTFERADAPAEAA